VSAVGQRAQLVAEIREAFADVPRPAGEALVPATPVRDRIREQVQADFDGRDWRDLDAAFLRERAEDLLLLSAEAFHHYLPAFLIASVEQPRDVDLVPAAVLLSLTAPDADSDPVARRYYDDRIGRLDAAQRDAVESFLRYAATHLGELFTRDEPATALRRWPAGR
jgi:hypothetical protein